MIRLLAGAIGIPMALTALLMPLASRLAHRLKVIDVPSARKIHRTATPLMGGLAVYAAVVIYEASRGDIAGKVLALVAACGVAVTLGAVDDRYDLPSRYRLGIHAALGLLLGLAGFRTGLLPIYADIALSVIWITGMINAINCFDCADGICGGVSGIILASYGVMLLMAGHASLAVISLAGAGAVGGFLLFNFPPARIFMGDCGSTALGLLIGAISIRATADSAPRYVLYTLLPVALPVLDILVVHIRRYCSGITNLRDLLSSTGKDHLPHRLLALGLTPRQNALAIYCMTALLASTPAMMRTYPTYGRILLLVGTGVIIAEEWAFYRLKQGVKGEPIVKGANGS